MTSTSAQPVIVGAGLSGMVISRALSRAGVAHLLLGDPPTTAPRLGESLSLDASLALPSFFPELSRFYFPKKRVIAYVGDFVSSCNVELGSLGKRALFKVLGYRQMDALLHIDRVGFDAALFETTVADPHCRHLAHRVTEISYDGDGDRVESLQLDDGGTLTPSVVFDATNHLRLLGRAAGVGCEMTSVPQRIAFTHLHLDADDPDDGAAPLWRHATNLLRLDPALDGLEGGAWCIPLGRYISIGTSMAADQNADLADDEILERVHGAFERRGLTYRDRFARERGPVGIRQRYFKHERSWGANWLLVGPSHSQIWWPSSTGVGTALAAGNVAAAFHRDPAAVGPLYQSYMDELDPTHHHLTWFMTLDRPADDAGAIRGHLCQLVRGHLVRLGLFAQMHNGGFANFVSRVVYRVVRRRQEFRANCRVRSVPLAQQTATLAAGLR